MPFLQFMQSPFGRILRVVLGLLLIGLGVFVLGGVWGAILAVIGLVPLAAGAFGLCLISPLFGADFHGHPGGRGLHPSR